MYWICHKHETLICCRLEAAKRKKTKEWGLPWALYFRSFRNQLSEINSLLRTWIQINEAAGFTFCLSFRCTLPLCHSKATLEPLVDLPMKWCVFLPFPSGRYLDQTQPHIQDEGKKSWLCCRLPWRKNHCSWWTRSTHLFIHLHYSDSWVDFWKRSERERILKLLPSSALHPFD